VQDKKKWVTSDYLSEMNAGRLKHWFAKSFLYYLEAGSNIILCNANYPFPSQMKFPALSLV
jgi:hypothetical protein